MKIEPVILEGPFVRLEPLTRDHIPALFQAANYPEIWEYMTSIVATPEDMVAYVSAALDQQAQGVALPFVTVHTATNTVVGSTRFGNIAPEHRRVEIGWTWITPRFQRTAVNTEAKWLMLTHAFEVWNCIRVEFKTDVLNTRSRRAIERLGAKQEGILHHHMILPDGRYRDSVYYRILATEWEPIKARLQSTLNPNA
ncbi:MAG: N-acetyltransferase [Gemmatimonadetes bacterium]|nr:MAG: N-acetyltransferase [Gemmatimonadota bacterium]